MDPRYPTPSQMQAFDKLKNKVPFPPVLGGKGPPNKNATLIWNEQRGAPEIIQGLGERIVGDHSAVAMRFVIELRDLFYPEGISPSSLPADRYEVIDTRPGPRDSIIVRMRQTVKGKEVWGSMWKVRMDKDGTVLGMSGAPIPIKRSDMPQGTIIAPDDAIQAAKDHHAPDELTVIDVPEQYFLMHQGKPHHVYVFAAGGAGIGRDGEKHPVTWRYFIDAISRDVIQRERIISGKSPDCSPVLKNKTSSEPVQRSGDWTDVVGFGYGHYYPSGVEFPTRQMASTANQPSKGKYALIDDSVTTGVEVHATLASTDKADLSMDDDNNWNAKEQETDVDGYVSTLKVRDYFAEKFERKMFFQSEVHKGCSMVVNAIRGDGDSMWDPNIWAVNLAQKRPEDPYWAPQCSLDVVAHEWAHALIRDENVLPYTNYWSQTSSLCEAMADAFAQFITNDKAWVRGREIWKRKDIAEGSRSMSDPTNRGTYDPRNPYDSYLPNASQPDHMDLFVDPEDCTGKDSCPHRKRCTADEPPCMPSHVNQGILNKVTYLLAMGGTHHGVDIGDGMGTETLEHLYYHCIVDKMPHHNHFIFKRFKEYLLSTLDDMYGESVWEKISDKDEASLAKDYYVFWKRIINNAFASVGIDKNDQATPLAKPTGTVNWP